LEKFASISSERMFESNFSRPREKVEDYKICYIVKQIAFERESSMIPALT